jgi:hypothetical protein
MSRPYMVFQTEKTIKSSKKRKNRLLNSKEKMLPAEPKQQSRVQSISRARRGPKDHAFLFLKIG